MSSTTNLTSSVSKTLSSEFFLSSREKEYWNPEHPPASTLNRSILPSADASLACNSFNL
uniref:Uncharacterized protein n=1 Tax=Arundo donax TaxID=35708 RepID=A0A0A9G7Y2_ARUDO